MRHSCNSKRIALVVPSMAGGGAERVMLNLAKGFVEENLIVDLLLLSASGPYLKSIPEGVNVIDLNTKRAVKSVPALVRYINNHRPSVVLSALRHLNVVLVISSFFAKYKPKIIVSEHNSIRSYVERAKGIRARVLPFLMSLTYPLSDAVVAVSQGVAIDLRSVIKVPEDKIKTIYNPVEIQEIRKLSFGPIKNEIGIQFDGTAKVILATGRLTEQKDFSTLIHSFNLVRNHHNAKLVILGEGPKRAVLEGLISKYNLSNDVFLPGFVDNPYSWMRRADLFVLSSRWEGLGLVLIEAMACGTSVVSTDCPSGPAEILENGKWGGLVEVGNHKELGSAISFALRTPREDLHNVEERASQFESHHAVSAYLKLFGLAAPGPDAM